MKEILLVTLVGLPASGKSSLCRTLTECSISDYYVVWIHFDDLIPLGALHPMPESDSEPSDWKRWRQVIHDCVERCIQACRNPTNQSSVTQECRSLLPSFPQFPDDSPSNVIFLLDDNFYYSSMRHAYYLLAKRYEAAYASVVCCAALSDCMERNRTRETAVPPNVISKMHQRIEWPDPEANRWEQYTFVVNTSKDTNSETLDSLQEFLISSSKKPFTYATEVEQAQRREQDRKANLESVLHQVDIALRSKVQVVMQSHTSHWKSKHSKQLSELKSDTLNVIRMKILSDSSNETLETYQREAITLFDSGLEKLHRQTTHS
ncbi:L-seryl-tRNA(Sec) kinase [Clonorchis sinensis]|uniref:L-seryl-tRNA(Sec) kinase n=1 Tax=Clonorchis sinensis TaxID=79923 RepID=A0A3R7H519_CLOSI|nr:L-seryl-tRNA(Sec) kinase [Clonorchis sinensis]